MSRHQLAYIYNLGVSVNRVDGTAITVRRITDEEVLRFRLDGWVRLPGLVDAGTCERIRQEGESRSEPDPGLTGFVEATYDQVRDVADISPAARGFLLHARMGSNMSRLLHDKPVRLEQNTILSKRPANGPNGHLASPLHQDFPYRPMDRSEALTLWVALSPITPDMGSLVFLDRSFQCGLLGRSFLVEDDSLDRQQPWLADFERSQPWDMMPGDATAHHLLTVHGASENRGETTRVALSTTYFAADTLYTGTPYGRTDGLGLSVNRPYDHPKFPLVPISDADD